jgi:hypothetical protein
MTDSVSDEDVFSFMLNGVEEKLKNEEKKQNGTNEKTDRSDKT